MQKGNHLNNRALIGLFAESTEAFLEALTKSTGKNFLNPEDALPYITFSKDDVFAFVCEKNKREQNQSAVLTQVPSAFFRTAGSQDGLYLVAVEGGFEMYDQERGVKGQVRKFESETMALSSLEKVNSDAMMADTDQIKAFVDRQCKIFGLEK